MAVERALLSVFEKTGIVGFARNLAALKIEILSTGGTAKLLRENGIAVKDVAEFTGWPEMLSGRVKTLHPKVHGGLLFRRNNPEDRNQATQQGIAPIDLVVVNLYPFEEVAARAYFPPEELVENIDIGGPTMLRSAAKNFESVTVVTDPDDYERVSAELAANQDTSLALRLELARKVFATTSRYDGAIAMNLERLGMLGDKIEVLPKPALPERLHLALRRKQELATAKIPIRARHSTSPPAPRPKASRPQSSFRARSFPTIIMSISKPREVSWPNSSGPQPSSSSTTTPAAPLSSPLLSTLMPRRWPATRFPLSAAFSLSTTSWTPSPLKKWPSCLSNVSLRPALLIALRKFLLQRRTCVFCICRSAGSSTTTNFSSSASSEACSCSNRTLAA